MPGVSLFFCSGFIFDGIEWRGWGNFLVLGYGGIGFRGLGELFYIFVFWVLNSF